ncbi:MAG: pseudouridine synthase [Pirellulaceae bacterium]|nr:pseudouridine synthase [Pirellulaceae bacterium]
MLSTAEAATDANPVVNIAAYKFVELSDLQPKRDRLKQTCKQLGLRGTILLSPEGINLFLAGSRSGIDQFLAVIRTLEGLTELEVKESYSRELPFNRMLVKIKREIIAFGVEGIAPAERTSAKLSAKQLKAWLDAGQPVRLLDTRNDYEVDLGTFRGAERLNIQHFREFPEASRQLPDQAKREPLVMFCTGGIRCEKAGPMLEKLGFEQVYQLDGGILKYFEECGGAHYDGGCFVFDSRVVLGPDLKPTGAIQCYGCQSVLTHEDIQSPQFSFGKSCPHCFRTESQAQEDQRLARETALRRLARSQPGCQPYENRRRMFVAAQWAGLTALDFLCAYHPPTPREQWLAWLAEESITSGNQRLDPESIVREGQQLDQVQADYTEPAVSSDIGLVYEDEWLVVINKPAPLPVHASGRFHRNTLEYMLAQVYRPEKLRLAHRLDAATTGLVVLARKYASARVLQPQFASGGIAKRYLLRVHGVPAADQFSCMAAIAEEPSERGGRQISPSGAPARTDFCVLKRFGDGSSLLSAEPLSGRTHQIRLHARHLDLPIVGDALYGRPGPSLDLVCVEPEVMCLHAWEIAFEHPITGQALKFVAPEPSWCDRES